MLNCPDSGLDPFDIVLERCSRASCKELTHHGKSSWTHTSDMKYNHFLVFERCLITRSAVNKILMRLKMRISACDGPLMGGGGLFIEDRIGGAVV